MSASTALVLRPADRLACRSWIKSHSKSFFLSSLLLPKQVRHAAWTLYAFCRRADDAVDEADDAGAMRRVARLRARLSRVYEGSADNDPIDRAFAAVVRLHEIPIELPSALLDGMEMDAQGSVYEDDQQLLVYCFRVASTVGLMMTRVMGVRSEVAYLRACDLGIAMQLTNIARDVGEDARRGRVYLPSTLCAELGIERTELLRAKVASPAIRESVRRILERAQVHYQSATFGIALLPRSSRLAIASSRYIYAAIGDSIAQNGFDSITTRAFVPLGRKLRLVVRASLRILGAPNRVALTLPGPSDALLRGLLSDVRLIDRSRRSTTQPSARAV